MKEVQRLNGCGLRIDFLGLKYSLAPSVKMLSKFWKEAMKFFINEKKEPGLHSKAKHSTNGRSIKGIKERLTGNRQIALVIFKKYC